MSKPKSRLTGIPSVPEALLLLVLWLLCSAVLSIQPPDGDDFNFYAAARRDGIFQTTWNCYRGWGGRPVAWFLATATGANPFSGIKPAAIGSAAVLLYFGFRFFKDLPLLLRGPCAAILLLGFPFAGHALTANSGASVYGAGAIFGILSLVMLHQNLTREVSSRSLILLGILVVLAGGTNEIWLFAHGGMTVALLCLFFIKRFKIDGRLALGYLAAMLVGGIIFLLGGNAKRIGVESAAIVASQGASSMSECLLFAARQTANTVVDFLPLLLLILAVAHFSRAKNTEPAEEQSEFPWPLIFGGMLGLFFFLFMLKYVNLPSQWRVRYIFCAYVLFVLYESSLGRLFWNGVPEKARTAFSIVLLLGGISLLSLNASRTFITTKVSVTKWLEWRETVSKGPLQPASWSSQDDRYRVHYPPTDAVRQQVEFAKQRYWGQ